MQFLITGAAGFIGRALSERLLENGHSVLAVDNLSDYYARSLKELRLSTLQKYEKFRFHHSDVKDMNFQGEKIDLVIHLAAQPGVRLKPTHYGKYFDSNLNGFLSVCKFVKNMNIRNFIYASSSSVYGDTSPIPFSEKQENLLPNSIYGYTKMLNEKIAEDFFGDDSEVNFLGLRFFTVYGDFGRPDMFYFKVIANILNKVPLNLFGNGTKERDFTYIDDVTYSIELLIEKLLDGKTKNIKIVNIGGGKPTSMNSIIEILENLTGAQSHIIELSGDPKDMQKTEADFNLLKSLIQYVPTTSIDEGLERFYNWIRMSSDSRILNEWVNNGQG